MSPQDECSPIPNKPAQFDYTLQDVDCQLRMAVKYGLVDVIYELVTRHNADINGINYEGRTPLIIAITQDQPPDMVELLCRLGADVSYAADRLHGYSALHFAAERNQAGVVEVLLEYGAQRDPRTFTGCTPLHLAARCGHFNTVRTLCLNGANVDTQEWYNAFTPLHYAVAHGHPDIVYLLLLEFNASPRPLLDTAWLTSSYYNSREILWRDQDIQEFVALSRSEPKYLETICLDVVRKNFLWPNANKKASKLPLPTNIKNKILLIEYD